jgi:hypothetical protein
VFPTGQAMTNIHFVRRDENLTVEGDPEEIAALAAKGCPVRLTTTEGRVIFVNWANVLYVEEVPHVTPASASGS